MIALAPLAAAVVSAAFAGLMAQQFFTRKRPHQLAWALALTMFALASLAAGRGIIAGWNPFLYRSYYLLGAVINVPMLALGTIYLLGPRRVAHAAAALVAVAVVYAAGAVFSAELLGPPSGQMDPLAVDSAIPSASLVIPGVVRRLSRLYSFTGFAIVVSGALWSAWRLSRKPDEYLRRLAQGNILIAVGTSVVAAASGFARHGNGFVFAIGLLAGVVIMFVGFLKIRLTNGNPVSLTNGNPVGDEQ
ncbi:MAG: hypothetical protein ACR2FO_05215 [Actinomycetota bacterium]